MELFVADVGMELPSYNPTLTLEELSKIIKPAVTIAANPATIRSEYFKNTL
jgi:hypothetical protein